MSIHLNHVRFEGGFESVHLITNKFTTQFVHKDANVTTNERGYFKCLGKVCLCCDIGQNRVEYKFYPVGSLKRESLEFLRVPVSSEKTSLLMQLKPFLMLEDPVERFVTIKKTPNGKYIVEAGKGGAQLIGEFDHLVKTFNENSAEILKGLEKKLLMIPISELLTVKSIRNELIIQGKLDKYLELAAQEPIEDSNGGSPNG